MSAHRVSDIIQWEFINSYVLQMVQDTYPSKILSSIRPLNGILRVATEEHAHVASKELLGKSYAYLQGSTTINAKDITALWNDPKSILFWLSLQAEGLAG